MAIDINALGLGERTKAFVLAALFNNASVTPTFICIIQNENFTTQNGSKMTIEIAQKILDSQNSGFFDYLYGRCLKINFDNSPFETRLYERDHGQGSVERAIYNSLDLLD